MVGLLHVPIVVHYKQRRPQIMRMPLRGQGFGRANYFRRVGDRLDAGLCALFTPVGCSLERSPQTLTLAYSCSVRWRTDSFRQLPEASEGCCVTGVTVAERASHCVQEDDRASLCCTNTSAGTAPY